MRLLIVEDNRNLADEVVRLLRRQAYAVDTAHDAETVLEAMDPKAYDLLIVDLGLPGVGGIELIRHLRTRGCQAPILILTAQDAVSQRVAGLDAGADDYVTKPFEVEELEARIRALLRRRAAPLTQQIDYGPLTFLTTRRQFQLNGAPLTLAAREHAVLEVLLRTAGATVSKETLLEAAYSQDDEVNPAAIEVIIHRLRKRLDGQSVTIATLRGLGYILRLTA